MRLLTVFTTIAIVSTAIATPLERRQVESSQAVSADGKQSQTSINSSSSTKSISTKSSVASKTISTKSSATPKPTHCMSFAEISDQWLTTFAKKDFSIEIESHKNVVNLACIDLKNPDKPINSYKTAKYTHVVFYEGKKCSGKTVHNGLGPDNDSNIVAKSFKLYCGENP
ncbi:uncharacterized protein VTP21DRAFT_8886 [Calcarisporiella thermophila]|uniref:uncharacterized protein n=1 Tax=Calcarisporiella thermophila TaxID=911321 RepID=UPI003743266E